ncbi:hypothetical protein CN206_32720, partial [Sinorhizobium meliloti]
CLYFAPHPSPLPARGERGRAPIGCNDEPASPFSPLKTGRRCRQADEGRPSVSQPTAAHNGRRALLVRCRNEPLLTAPSYRHSICHTDLLDQPVDQLEAPR